ncbi:hypothetical protein ELI00_03805 [Rhizobium ruizarguesonis]|uniref:hypothetical protein n=1 Tax=Rhizobium ruizarguesonis TaxID=2081791 RepID=UPI0010308362|nr:hypothetical protein [Rhizobium ruizarguesonis]TAX75463.1 hypothetical protein ELI00_03805 [Rhizobium ruizarguesonis]
MTTEQIQTADDLANFVKVRCDEHWTNTRQALLLTTLGTEAIALMIDKTLLRRLGGLKSFIEATVKSLRVISHKIATGKHGVVPADADIPEDTDFLFAAASTPPTQHLAIEQRSFHSGFWKAFKDPLIPGRARVWSSSSPQHYSDILMGEPIPEHAVEIPEKFILGIEGLLGPGDAAKLRKLIKEYIEERDLDESIFVSSKVKKIDKSYSYVSISGQTNGDFVTALTKLSKSDQARISIPLDIVMELFRLR